MLIVHILAGYDAYSLIASDETYISIIHFAPVANRHTTGEPELLVYFVNNLICYTCQCDFSLL